MGVTDQITPDPFRGSKATPSSQTKEFAASPNVLSSSEGGPVGTTGGEVDLAKVNLSYDDLAGLAKQINKDYTDEQAEVESSVDEAIAKVNEQLQIITDFELPKASWTERMFNGNYKQDRAIEQAQIKGDALKTLLPVLERLLDEKRQLSKMDPLKEAFLKETQASMGRALRREELSKEIDEYKRRGGVLSLEQEMEIRNSLDIKDDSSGPTYPTVSDLTGAANLGKSLKDAAKARGAFTDAMDPTGLKRDVAEAGALEALRVERLKREKERAAIRYRDAKDDEAARAKAQEAMDKAEADLEFAPGYPEIDDAYKAIETQISFMTEKGWIDLVPKVHTYESENQFAFDPPQMYQKDVYKWVPSQAWPIRRQIEEAARYKGLTASLPRMYPELFADQAGLLTPEQKRAKRYQEIRQGYSEVPDAGAESPGP